MYRMPVKVLSGMYKIQYTTYHRLSFLVKALCDHDRNLTDEQLRALAKNGGVAQLCLLDAYINKNPKAASVCDAAEHLDHMIKVAGIDHVGIGTDFDGGGGLQGCNGDNDLINLTIKMIEKGYQKKT